MRHWADQLRQRQVQLLVVAVPDKSRIEADRLCGLPASQPMRRVLDDWQRALQAQGVPFVDLRPALSGAAEPMFFRTDVHMNAQGAQAAARDAWPTPRCRCWAASASRLSVSTRRARRRRAWAI